MPIPPTVEKTLSGWGRHPVARSRVARPEKRRALAALVAHPPGGALLARGRGRSYGDAALLDGDGGATVLTERLNRMLAFDDATGRLRCEAGVTLREIIRTFLPRGWFLPVTPGTKHVSVGGAVACDVHGKNHHRVGAFSQFVDELTLLTASGETVTCSSGERDELFRATVGGMGLTGIITEVALRLKRVPSAYVRIRNVKTRDLDETLSLLDERSSEHAYAVAWLDALASGDALGRGLVTSGEHAEPNDLPAHQRKRPYETSARFRLSVPFDAPVGLLSEQTARVFNALYYAWHLGKEKRDVVSCERFFYPLDAVENWNRAYGRRGFVQHQSVVPEPGTVRRLLRACRREGRGVLLAVLKRLGAESAGHLSFPKPGYTLSLDLPAAPGIEDFLRRLDEIVLDASGRVYLAKDAHLDPAAFRAAYSDFREWQRVKREIDPDGVFTSEMARRLRLVD